MLSTPRSTLIAIVVAASSGFGFVAASARAEIRPPVRTAVFTPADAEIMRHQFIVGGAPRGPSRSYAARYGLVRPPFAYQYSPLYYSYYGGYHHGAYGYFRPSQRVSATQPLQPLSAYQAGGCYYW